ncbi:hypothetical protein RJT34_26397 [Clitoria ternatea]|uniref:TF-B3 domain-containing protein n=1 Tax=Clitoria ternatea TaxID=43366 RepID=A0AAN9IAH3_CLITE
MASNTTICTHLTLGGCPCSNTNTNTNTNIICTHLTINVCPCTNLKTHASASSSKKESVVAAKKRYIDTATSSKKESATARKKRCIDNKERLTGDDIWKIKKVLLKSDVGNMSRLMLGKDLAENYVLPMLGANHANNIKDKGVNVKIWDVDTNTMHSLLFKLWGSSNCYVFIGKWIQDFVKRRNLKNGDEIGLYWDANQNHFNFSVLHVS